ncbi:MAG: hypothetical protein E4H33_03785 [Anaerolineales bacterium]|nr:MAG: hypothetical protein E4H33_03785 [Anaerolineales bacterium]
MSDVQKPTRINDFSPRLLIIPSLLIILSLACNLPILQSKSIQPEQPGFIETGIAETMAALEGDQPADADDQSGQEAEVLPAAETLTPEITDTPTLTPTVTNTPTPEVAMIYSSANTNCRNGQGTYFPWVVTLNQGESSEAVGIDTSGEYWYIRRPDQPSSFCWLWGKYATPSGPWESLPVYTPIPTPTPGLDYKLTFYNVTGCVGNRYVQFQIDNNGSFPLESWKSSGTDNSGGIVNLPVQKDEFYYQENCPTTQSQNDLEPGEGSFLNVTFLGDPTGHNLTVSINVCTKNAMAGKCLKKTFNIKP